MSDVLALCGAVLILTGLAMIYIPMSVIAAGLVLIALAVLLEKGKRGTARTAD
jgi:hypothetical protein